MSLFHRYPIISSTREIQEEYEREHDAAAEVQNLHFAVAPRRQLTTPLGRVVPSGAEVTVDDFVGCDDSPFGALRRAVLDGEVLMPRHLGIDDPRVRRVPSMTVSNDKVVADPDYGWHRHGVAFGSDAARDAGRTPARRPGEPRACSTSSRPSRRCDCAMVRSIRDQIDELPCVLMQHEQDAVATVIAAIIWAVLDASVRDLGDELVA